MLHSIQFITALLFAASMSTGLANPIKTSDNTTFLCKSLDKTLSVDVEISNSSSPTTRTTIKVSQAVDGELSGWEDTYTANEPVYRSFRTGQLEIIIGFGRQSSMTIWTQLNGSDTEESSKGYIEFAGGPHWNLSCKKI